MKVKLAILGSGSSGNSLVLQSPTSSLMVDAGFSGKELTRRLSLHNIVPEELNGILITHEHADHTKGCRIFGDKTQVPVYMSMGTASFLRTKEKMLPQNTKEFEAGAIFSLGDFEIAPFSVQHDAVDPVGYTFKVGNFKIGLAYDLGEVNLLAMNRLSECDILIIESNYDCCMLRDCDRPLRIKRRVAGRHGHLDNKDALCAIDKLIAPKTKAVVLTHLSSECNTRDIAHSGIAQLLKFKQREDIKLIVATHEPDLETHEFEA